MSKTNYTPFVAHPAHRAMTESDAAIFMLAAEMLANPQVSKAITDAGGDTANMAHFSRKECRGRPINAWAADNAHEDVQAALVRVGESLKG